MEGDPSREELLAMLSGEGYSGGAKKRVPKGLKSWIAFRKKHPNMTIQQQSRAYKKKGKGLGEEEAEEDVYGAGEMSDMEGGRRRRRKKTTRRKKGKGVEEYMTGGADPSSIPSSKEAWQTKTVRKVAKLIKLGEQAWKAAKLTFPKEYALITRKVGGGISYQDYVRFVKSDPESLKSSGEALRGKWDAHIADPDNRKKYLSAKETIFYEIGNNIQQLVFDDDSVKAVELGESMF